MKRKDVEKIILAALVIVAILVVIFVTTSILAPPKRSTKADKVNFECLTEPKAKPLAECKE